MLLALPGDCVIILNCRDSENTSFSKNASIIYCAYYFYCFIGKKIKISTKIIFTKIEIFENRKTVDYFFGEDNSTKSLNTISGFQNVKWLLCFSTL